MENLYIYIPVALAILELILRLIPTEKDKSVVNFLIWILEAIPNKGKKGARFVTKTVTRRDY